MGPRQVGKSTIVKQVLQDLDAPWLLQDAGNTTTLAGYVQLLDEAGMLCGLQKYSIDMARRKSSIPKFQVYNALKTIYSLHTFEQSMMDRKVLGLGNPDKDYVRRIAEEFVNETIKGTRLHGM